MISYKWLIYIYLSKMGLFTCLLQDPKIIQQAHIAGWCRRFEFEQKMAQQSTEIDISNCRRFKKYWYSLPSKEDTPYSIVRAWIIVPYFPCSFGHDKIFQLSPLKNNLVLIFFSTSVRTGFVSLRNLVVESNNSTSLCKHTPLDNHLTSVSRSNGLNNS